MRSLLCLLFVSFLVPALWAKTGVIEQEGNPSFSACYLTPQDASVCNYAILYKGLTVEVIGGTASSRYKVKVPMGDSKVVVADGWQGRPDSEGEGWVAPRFLKVQEESAPDNTSGGLSFLGEDLNGGVYDANTTTDGSGTGLDQDWMNAVRNYMTLQHGLSFLGQNTPGDTSISGGLFDTPSNTTNTVQGGGEGIYYVFAGMGQDQEFFYQISQNGPIAGKPNYVYKYIRRDIQESGAKCKGIVVVKVLTPDDMHNVLCQGMVPAAGPSAVPSGNQRLKIYAVNELTPSNFKVIGFATVSHSGQDGPMMDYADNKGKQYHARYLANDYVTHSRNPGAKTFTARLVNKPRFTFCGCNIGHCQYYDGVNPCFSHWVATIYCKKGAVVRGKYTVGSPNATEKQFATFGREGNGSVIRQSPAKKEYRMLIKVPTNRYDTYNVPFSSAEEKEAILAYYKERNVTVRESGNNIVVRTPSWLRGKWMNRGTDKDDLLEAVLRTMASRDISTARWMDTYESWMRRNPPAEVARAEKMMPRLKELLNDPKLQKRIEEVKEENGGTLDLHDFRLWHYIYFGNLSQEQMRENRWSLPLRACTCDDAKHTNAFLNN